jgi:hypothetical protein
MAPLPVCAGADIARERVRNNVAENTTSKLFDVIAHSFAPMSPFLLREMIAPDSRDRKVKGL